MITQIISTYRIESGLRTEATASYVNCPYFAKIYNKNNKLIKNLIFRTEESMDKYIADFIETQQLKLDAKIAERQANKLITAAQFYEVGDIIVNSLGYDQTNVSFYKVVEVKNKTIRIQELAQHVVENSYYGMACDVMPGDSYIPNGEQYTLRVKAGGRLSQPNSYYYMTKWDGRKMYKSWYS